MEFGEYIAVFSEIDRDFQKAVQEFGLVFESEESSLRTQRAKIANKTGFHLENNDSSLWSTWISPACIACRTGEKTATYFVDLQCNKDCYFCFNPNQENYEYFLSHHRNIIDELEFAYAQGSQFDCLAITGGEPLLHAEYVIAFVQCARALYPLAHIRLYTNGELLTDSILSQLAEAGLSELRFSIKPRDVESDTDSIYEKVQQAVSYIPTVMFEVPVVPGSLSEMKDMMMQAEMLGVKCINLLEMCFPLNNAEEFRKRGLQLRKRPYDILYNYWYGGGIPIAKSEFEALQLVNFAHEKQLNLSVHYCSSDNKNTGQIYQQNTVFMQDKNLQAAYPYLSLDPTDWFIKCAKVFGSDVSTVKNFLDTQSCESFNYDEDLSILSFPISFAEPLKKQFVDLRIAESIHVVEFDENQNPVIKEIWAREID